MTGEELDEIKARCEAATPGRWCATRGTTVHYIHADGHSHLAKVYSQGGGRAQDADFIAAAREDVPRLVAEVERLRAEVAALKARVAGLKAWW